MPTVNGKFWWDPTPGVIAYNVTITPSLGSLPVFTGSTSNNYINTTSLPLIDGVNYDVNILAYCESGSTTTNTLSLFIDPDGTYSPPTNSFQLLIQNTSSWATITGVKNDKGTSVSFTCTPGEAGYIINPTPGVYSTSSSSPVTISPYWYTNNFFLTFQNTTGTLQFALFGPTL